MNNLKQLTNFDLDLAYDTTKTFRKGGDAGEVVTYPYKVIPSSLLGSENIFKFGYCTNNNTGIDYPIYLTLNGIETQFFIGKTGMFEFQPEEWRDVNDDDEERTAITYLSQVEVPADIPFCIDYCYSI